jgi:hypothetical protein
MPLDVGTGVGVAAEVEAEGAPDEDGPPPETSAAGRTPP